MKRLILGPALIVLVSAFALGAYVPMAKAEAIATWLTPWNLSYENVASGSPGTFSLGYCFGVDCPHNAAGPGLTVPGPLGNLGAAGESLDIFATPGHFEEDIGTTIGFGFPSVATEDLVFARQFQLAGSPTGWDFVLSGSYVAFGSVENANFSPLVNLRFSASVFPGELTLNDIFALNLPGALLPFLVFSTAPVLDATLTSALQIFRVHAAGARAWR
jgi:hypothetical protein